MNNGKGVDLRVRRSKAAIRNAVSSLLADHSVLDISPKDVAERALINKKTFFAHYDSVLAVIDEMEEDALTEVFSAVEREDTSDERGIEKVCDRLRELARDGASTFGSLFPTRLRDDLLGRVRAELDARISHRPELSGLPEAMRDRALRTIDFFSAGIVSLTSGWISDDGGMSSAELARELRRAIDSCGSELRGLAAAEAASQDVAANAGT